MRFNPGKAKIWVVPPVNPGEYGGMAVLDNEGYLIAYKRKRDNDLRNWDFVRADFRENRLDKS
jgi:hypothetical protein